MNTPKNSRLESGTVHFKTIEGIQFWMTPQNQIFLMSEAGEQVYPSNREHDIGGLPDAVVVELKRLQAVQSAIRKGWENEDKDSPDAWSFSDDPGLRQSSGAGSAMSGSQGFSHHGARGNQA